MTLLTLRSWLWLLYFDCLIQFREFGDMHTTVRRRRYTRTEPPSVPYATICHAMDLASVLYFKRVLCLQRSAATARLLRSYGWDAEMVIGVQLLPFQSHAWVEIEGHVVNDKPYVVDDFQVLERC
jgi:hypothetical protein